MASQRRAVRIEDGNVLWPYLGLRILTVEQLRWRDTTVGLQLEFGAGRVLLANNADEIFLSTGALPADYLDATFEA